VSPQAGVELRHAQGADTYRGWFAADVYNWDENPPWQPRYVDLALTEGIRVNGSADITVGAPLEVTATVANMGQYVSRFKSLYIYVRDPSGYNADHLLHGAEPDLTQLQPGERYTITRKVDEFAPAPGVYRVGASYLSQTDHWCDMAVSGGQRAIDVTVHPASFAQVADQWFSIPESAAEPVRTGINLQPGDEFQLTGQGQIWAGVWLTGNNGPEGWRDYVTQNPQFPLHGTQDSCQFSLIAQVGGDGWFYVGNGISRRGYAGGGGELCLWINDDVHNNGNGAFECRVQAWR